MRLWSLHPQYLDPQGLVALWREGLLARAVLRGETRGYTRHPQLERFQAHATPRLAINSYLAAVHAEATRRGYHFDRSKLGPGRPGLRLGVSRGQLEHEWQHLLRKLQQRSPELHARWHGTTQTLAHPMFEVRPGPIAGWERP
jgi:hypothetical protein